jgi:hypothetical protein
MQPVTATASKNNRHDTMSDVDIFLQREHPDRQKTIEVVCSSARRDMDRSARHVPYRLFCETMNLFPETVNPPSSSSAEARADWPSTTKIVCWHDCHPFDTVPLPIPKFSRASSNNAGQQYTVYGVFCSCNCAIAYILERNTYDQQQLLLRFKQMAMNIFMLPSTDVFAFEPAPPRIFLQLFGGHLTIDEFRRSSLVTRNTLISPPFISYSMVLEENARQLQVDRTAGKQDGVSGDTTAADTGYGHTTGGATDPGTRSAAGSTSPARAAASRVSNTSLVMTHGTRGLRRPAPNLSHAPDTGRGSDDAETPHTNVVPSVTADSTRLASLSPFDHPCSSAPLVSPYITFVNNRTAPMDVVHGGVRADGAEDGSPDGGGAAAGATTLSDPKPGKSATAVLKKNGRKNVKAGAGGVPPPQSALAAFQVGTGTLAAYLQSTPRK